MSKLIPILYQPDMVRAKLDLRKSQTRRLLQHPSTATAFDYVFDPTVGLWFPMDKNGKVDFADYIKPKYGLPGDILWTRENYTQNGLEYYRYKADWGNGKYPTGEPEGTFINKSVPEKFRGKWKPSIHMPFEACRLFDKVTAVRIERLQDITEADAIAEGVEKVHDGYKHYLNPAIPSQTARESYRTLWISINGLESWNANPFVWVIEFEPTTKPTNL